MAPPGAPGLAGPWPWPRPSPGSGLVALLQVCIFKLSLHYVVSPVDTFAFKQRLEKALNSFNQAFNNFKKGFTNLENGFQKQAWP